MKLVITIFMLFNAAMLQAESRRDDRELKIVIWQGVTSLNPYLAQGSKDLDAISLLLEPLASYDRDGNVVPVLLAEVPTFENGGISADLKSMTLKLRSDIKWSDGIPLTSEDVVFGYRYCLHRGHCQEIDTVESLELHTVRVNFSLPKAYPYAYITGGFVVQKRQFGHCLQTEDLQCPEQIILPEGTGPFVVEDFRPNDLVIYNVNSHYRDIAAGRPYFTRVLIQSGVDAITAVSSVLETGEFDYAWNVQVEPRILDNMLSNGNKGRLVGTLDG